MPRFSCSSSSSIASGKRGSCHNPDYMTHEVVRVGERSLAGMSGNKAALLLAAEMAVN